LPDQVHVLHRLNKLELKNVLCVRLLPCLSLDSAAGTVKVASSRNQSGVVARAHYHPR
jgi:hypothetical protein